MTPSSYPGNLAHVEAALAAVEAQLAQLGDTSAAAEHRETMRQMRERFERRLELITRAHQAAMSLARFSSPSELLLQAPGALVGGTGFRRVLLSAIDGDLLSPVAANFAIGDDPEIDADLASDALARLRESPARLTHQLVDSDAVRRRRAALVAPAEGNTRAAVRINETIGWAAYVVAPIVSGTTAIALVHADRGPNVPLDVVDRDAIGEFASVASRLYESVYLRRTLLQERDGVRRFLDRLNALSISLADTPVTLGGDENGGTGSASPILAAEISNRSALEDDRLVFSGLLTKRELEVLRLLADGGTNRSIAGALVLSDTTVKFHVSSILRKLHVANRAEAVVRYLTLSGVPRSPSS